MSDDAPLRLKHARATSPELAHALRALGRASDGERLRRVAEQLEAALAGGAPQPMAASAIGSLAVKWLIAGALAVGGFWAWRSEQPQPSAAVRAPAAVVSAPAVNASVVAAIGGDVSAPAPSPIDDDARASAAPPKPPARAHRERRATAPHAANPATPSDAIAAVPASTADIAAPPALPPSEPATAPPVLHEQSHSQPPPAAASQAGGERSEAALLLAARKAQPTAALRLLAEHATRFPDGLLAPEREVLRIEALRKLGHRAEAEQDLRAFQARYPDSIHLHRLLATQRD